MGQGHRKTPGGRWGLSAVILSVAMMGCTGNPADTANAEGKVNGRRTGTTTKPGGGTTTTPASKAPGLGNEEPGTGGLGSVSPPPSTAVTASNKPASADPTATTAASPTPAASGTPSPSPSPSVAILPDAAPTPIVDPPAGPIKRVSAIWAARVLAGGNTGTVAQGTGKAALLGGPTDEAFEIPVVGLAYHTAKQRLYFTDPYNNQVRSVDVPTDLNASGTVRLELGSPNGQPEDGTGVPGGVVALRQPTGMVLDANNRLVFGESSGQRLWAYDPDLHNASTVNTTQTATALAGTGQRGQPPATYVDGAGASATIDNLQGLALDGSTLYMMDAGFFTVRSAALGDPATPFSFVAGLKEPDETKFNPPALSVNPVNRDVAGFAQPSGIVVMTMPADAKGSAAPLAGKKVLLVAEHFRNCIHAVDLSSGNGQVYTLVGKGVPGNEDGTLATASLGAPTALAVDGKGKVYLGETGSNNHRLRVIDFANDRVDTLLGELNLSNEVVQPGGAVPRGRARFGYISGLTLLNDGNGNANRIFVYDYGRTRSTAQGAVAPVEGPRVMELRLISE